MDLWTIDKDVFFVAGRPTKLTLEIYEKIMELLSEGYTVKATCGKVGISTSAFYVWVERGQIHKTNTLFKKLATGVEINQGKGQAEYEDVVREEALEKRNWKAAAWYLEKIDPENFGSNNKIQAEITSENRTDVTINKISIDPKVDEELNDLLKPRYITTSQKSDSQ